MLCLDVAQLDILQQIVIYDVRNISCSSSKKATFVDVEPGLMTRIRCMFV